MKKVYICHGSQAYQFLFESLGFTVVDSVDQCHLVCFTGGADVSPDLYGDARHPFTYNDPYRDSVEREVFNKAQQLGRACVGICRGGQFLNVMNGGRMYQHVDRHGVSHELTDLETGEVIYVSSTHHQMFMPAEQAKIVACSYLGGSREWYEGQVFKKDIADRDYEVVYYEGTNSLCFQPHPEFNRPEYEGMKNYFGSLLAKYMGL